MPESPEVIILKNYLNKYIKNSFIQKITFLGGPFVKNKNKIYSKPRHIASILNRNISVNKHKIQIQSILNKGKFIYLCIYNKNNKKKYVFGSLLGLSGNWVISENLPKNSRISIELCKFVIKNHKKICKYFVLYYVDVRNYGKFYIEDNKWLNKKLKTIGPDIMDPNLTITKFIKIFRNAAEKTPTLKLHMVLVNQSIISGIGNYLRSEILYKVKNIITNPFEYVLKLTDNQLKHLYTISRTLIRNIIKKYGIKSIYRNSGHYNPIVYRKKTTLIGDNISKIIDKNGRAFYYVKYNDSK